MSATYTPEYAKLKRAQAELSTLEAALQRNEAQILHSVQNDYDDAARREKLLAEAYNSQTARVTKDAEKSIRYNILQREVDSSQQLYQTMLERLKESTIASAMRASNVRVIDLARVPEFPSSPNIPQTTGLGLVAGAFLGAAVLTMREHANRTIRQPGESGLLLHTIELGVIPLGNVHLRPPRIAASSGHADRSKILFTSPAVSKRTGNLTAFERESSMLSASFRSTLLSILLTSENGSRPKVLVVTSAGPKEGKSTVVSNLGIAAAEFGQKVLLIDADMRRPRLHEIFGMNNDRGLSTILLSMAALNGDKSLGGVVTETAVAGLSVLSSGPATSGSTQLLYTSYVANLLKYLRREFDLILIDTPPVLPVPDARVLGRIADKVLLVIRAGHTRREAASAAWQRLRHDGSPLLGTIFNHWDFKSASDLYGRDYGDYYRDQKACLPSSHLTS